MKGLVYSFLFLLIASCSSMRSGKFVKLNSLSELPQLATHFGTTVKEIKNVNESIAPGKWIFIPTKRGIYYIDSNSSLMSFSGSGEYLWPLPYHNTITSYYGWRKRRHHDGIDISAPQGTPIVASRDGLVIYSGKMRGYGKVIIVRHDDGYHTVYAHNSRNIADKGDRVDRGQVIAKVGSTGRATGNHLHFEVRKENSPTDPLKYLNPQQAVAKN
ncbi:MAG: M23 family metallopeptidase [Halobacteriovoraceae bacterium]|nr:M23 family metallopeptidase [Halobacteriovoraceae bacterium]